MDTTNYIRILAKANLALLGLYVVATFSLERYLPQELQAYLSSELDGELKTTDVLISIALLVVLVAHITALIGLIRIKQWAPKYFVYSTLGIFALLPFVGPYVDHAFAATIDDISVLTLGAILAMLYTTESKFNKAIHRISSPSL